MLQGLRAEIDRLNAAQGETAKIKRGDTAYAIRNLLQDFVGIQSILRDSVLLDCTRGLIDGAVCAVRGILFDKPFRANWFVPWHQDMTIAVKQRRELAGFDSWTCKAGVTHVRPPARILERMLTLRIHLDDASEANGALRIIPGSHRYGLISANGLAPHLRSGSRVCANPWQKNPCPTAA